MTKVRDEFGTGIVTPEIWAIMRREAGLRLERELEKLEAIGARDMGHLSLRQAEVFHDAINKLHAVVETLKQEA